MHGTETLYNTRNRRPSRDASITVSDVIFVEQDGHLAGQCCWPAMLRDRSTTFFIACRVTLLLLLFVVIATTDHGDACVVTVLVITMTLLAPCHMHTSNIMRVHRAHVSVTNFRKTRSSAIAEGPRDASCQSKSCQLPRNSA